MKFLFIALLTFGFSAQAAMKTVVLNLNKESQAGNETMCIYAADIALGNSNSIKPFQFLTQTEDGNFAVMVRPNVLIPSKNGVFFARPTAVKMVAAGTACPRTSEVYLVQ